MTGIDALSIIVAGAVLPLIVAIFARQGLTAAQKRGVALAVAVVLGTLSALVTGQIDGVPETVTAWLVRILGWIAAVVVAGQAIHRQIKDVTDAIEYAPQRAIEDELT